MLSLLVVAFPISVFTHLWEEEFTGYRGSELTQPEEDLSIRDVASGIGFGAGGGGVVLGGGDGGAVGGGKRSTVQFRESDMPGERGVKVKPGSKEMEEIRVQLARIEDAQARINELLSNLG